MGKNIPPFDSTSRQDAYDLIEAKLAQSKNGEIPVMICFKSVVVRATLEYNYYYKENFISDVARYYATSGDIVQAYIQPSEIFKAYIPDDGLLTIDL